MKEKLLTHRFKTRLDSILNLFDKKIVIDKDKAFLVLLRFINSESKKAFTKDNRSFNHWEKAYKWESRKALARELLEAYLINRRGANVESGSIKDKSKAS